MQAERHGFEVERKIMGMKSFWDNSWESINPDRLTRYIRSAFDMGMDLIYSEVPEAK